jgi:drug/metabolite transporter (DMT)-like permease
MNNSKGVFFALLAAASYGLMSFLVHRNPGGHPVEQLIFLRGILTLLVLLPFCYQDLHFYFRKSGFSLWVRSLAGAGGVVCYFHALQGTTSANANVLFSSSPIFVVILSWLLFREKLSRREFFGVGVIVLGNLLLYLPNRSSMPFWVWASATGGALFASVAFLSLGKATKKYSSSLIVVGFAVASSALALVLPTKPWLELVQQDGIFLFTVSFLGLFSQWAVTKSFANLNSSVATALGRSSILFNGILDVTVARYHPHWLEWFSYFLVLTGIYLSNTRNPKRENQKII